MQKIFEKIKERLEEEVAYQNSKADAAGKTCAFEEIPVVKAREKMAECYEHAIEVVDQVAEECATDTNVGSRKLLDSLHEKILKSKFAEEVTEAEIEALVKTKELTNNNQSLANDGWIPCSSGKMPENGRRCWVTYEWANGSLHVDKDYLVNGKWFETKDEAVKAWMYNDEETPEPYQPKGDKS